MQQDDNQSQLQSATGTEIPKPLTPINVPYFDASSVVIHATGNNVVLLFSRPVPVEPIPGVGPQLIGQPMAVISLSPQSAKDLLLLIQTVITDHEKDFGEIETPYTKKLKAPQQ